MSVGTIILIVAAVLIVGCLFIHRRVVRALLTGKPMPKAPKWHFWVAPDKRRG